MCCTSKQALHRHLAGNSRGIWKQYTQQWREMLKRRRIWAFTIRLQLQRNRWRFEDGWVRSLCYFWSKRAASKAFEVWLLLQQFVASQRFYCFPFVASLQKLCFEYLSITSGFGGNENLSLKSLLTFSLPERRGRAECLLQFPHLSARWCCLAADRGVKGWASMRSWLTLIRSPSRLENWPLITSRYTLRNRHCTF